MPFGSAPLHVEVASAKLRSASAALPAHGAAFKCITEQHCLHDCTSTAIVSQVEASVCCAPAGQGFGLTSNNAAGGSNPGVSGFGGTTSTGQFVVDTCGTSSPVIYAGAGAGSGTTAVAGTPGALAAATAG